MGKINIFKKKIIYGVCIFGAIFIIHFCIMDINGISINSRSIAIESQLLFVYLGWLGIGELTRLGKRQIVRIARIPIIIFIISILLHLVGGEEAVKLLLFSSAIMLWTFIMAIWYRRKEFNSRGSASER